MAGDIFLKLTGIEGESTDDVHAKEIEVLSFSSGVTMPVSPQSTAGSGTMERASLSDLTITKNIDAASPALFEHACGGAVIDEAVLSVNRAAGGAKAEYLKYTLTEVLVSSYQVGASEGGGLPLETVSLNYKTFKVEYAPTVRGTGAAQGAKVAGWDVAANKPL